MVDGRRLAVVVAVDRYDDPGLRSLRAPAADAEALAGVLGDPGLGAFEVTVVHNQRSSVICEQVEQILADRGRDDLVVLHFSCHGIKDDSGELFLAATNTVPRRLASTAVDAALVSRLMQRSLARRVVLLLDCCYGGAFERGMIPRAGGGVDVGERFLRERVHSGQGRAVITASTAMQYAFEGQQLTDDHLAGPSLFTSAVVEGIRTGEADRDQDGQVALGELYEYVYDYVRAREPHQTPCKWEFGLQGGLYLARNPRWRLRPASLPPEVLDLLTYPAPAGRIGAVTELTRLAAGADLPVAVAARAELRRLSEDDSRRVAEAASNALRDTALRLSASMVDFGRVSVDGRAAREVDVGGGRLALESTVTSSLPEILRARLDGAVLRLTWTPAAEGALRGEVIVTGPAGEATVQATGYAVGPATPAPVKPAPRQSTTDEPVARQDPAPPVSPMPTGLTDDLPPIKPGLGGYAFAVAFAIAALVIFLAGMNTAVVVLAALAALGSAAGIALSRHSARRRRRLVEALIVRDRQRRTRPSG